MCLSGLSVKVPSTFLLSSPNFLGFFWGDRQQCSSSVPPPLHITCFCHRRGDGAPGIATEVTIFTCAQPCIKKSVGNVTRHFVVRKKQSVQFKGSRNGCRNIPGDLIVSHIYNLKIVWRWKSSNFGWSKPCFRNRTSDRIVFQIN